MQFSISSPWSEQIQWIVTFIVLVNCQPMATTCPIYCQCVPLLMDCKEPGLLDLPEPPSNSLEMVVIENQTFRRAHLDRDSLRPYWSSKHGGKVKLKLLKIRHCNIISLAEDTFANLGTQLEELDLSGNPLHTIEAGVFQGLKLKSLFLNNLQKPRIHDHAFSGVVEISSLSLQYSRITELPFHSLYELSHNYGLKSLLLRGNKIARVPSMYESIFRQLQTLELTENPWHCDCNLRWLIELYRVSKLASAISKSKGKMSDSGPLTCASPASFENQEFNQIALKVSDLYPDKYNAGMRKMPLLSCQMPRLEHVDIYLHHELTTSDSELGNKAKLACQMTGSPEVLISWTHFSISGVERNVTDSAKLISFQSGAPPFRYRSSSITNRTSFLSVQQISEADFYSCTGSNSLGNVSVTIKIHWPPKLTPIVLPTSTNELAITDKTNGETIGSRLPIRHDEYSILAKRFNLVDVIGAVLGTFLVTLLCFILAYRSSKFYTYRRLKLRAHISPPEHVMMQDSSKRSPSSSGATSSLLKFSQPNEQSSKQSRYPEFATTSSQVACNHQSPLMQGTNRPRPSFDELPSRSQQQQQQHQYTLAVGPKQRDSGTFNSHSTTSSATGNAPNPYETVYNESNPTMYDTPSENIACQSQPFLFQLVSQAPNGYPIVFTNTLPLNAEGFPPLVRSPPTYIPPPPIGQQPSLPRRTQQFPMTPGNCILLNGEQYAMTPEPLLANRIS